MDLQLTNLCIFTVFLLSFGLVQTQEPQCTIRIVESMPLGVKHPKGSPRFMSTHDAWLQLIGNATQKIDIGSAYWTLLFGNVSKHPSALQGRDIYDALVKAGTERGIKIHINQNKNLIGFPQLDTKYLAQQKAAEVRSVDFQKIIGQFGIFHTKLWIVDGKHMYLGSANTDWRSIIQTEELGFLLWNCPALVSDAQKLFDVVWDLTEKGAVLSDDLLAKYSTDINAAKPLPVQFANGFTSNAYFSSAPPQICPPGRMHDLDAIKDVMNNAKKFMYISVMEYHPFSWALNDGDPFAIKISPQLSITIKSWPDLDNAIRAAAIDHRVEVKLLVTWWLANPYPHEDYYLNSLRSISGAFPGIPGVYSTFPNIQVKRFVVPADEEQQNILGARYMHDKFMVTDSQAFIGTSNWGPEYFTSWAGASLVLTDPSLGDTDQVCQSTIRQDLLSIFNRDWYSPYAHDLFIPAPPQPTYQKIKNYYTTIQQSPASPLN